MPDLPVINPPAIVVTASRAEERASDTPASVSLIDARRIERLGTSLVSDLLRLTPSASVAVSGPAGSQTQLRIRGAEANHVLLFVEGIRANDPAAGNEPRFELLNADLASRIEVIRGPQSALWGSEAIGGVVAVQGEAPGSGGTQAFAEAGSHTSLRGAARTTLGNADRGISLGVAGQRSDGIDAFSGDGERDGYHNVGMRASGRYRLSPDIMIGASGFGLWGKSEFDGYAPPTFGRADTLDKTRNQLAAGRLFAEVGQRERTYAVASASLLGSSNRNLLDDVPQNRTSARRRTLGLEAGHNLDGHLFIAALESELEHFHARDTAFGGLTTQDRSRRHNSLTLEWRGKKIGPLSPGLAVRHDAFSRFNDATTFRASLKVDIASGVSISGNYGEGIAQPTFFDLYGFFPDFFIGNPDLKPEQSKGWEISGRFVRGSFHGALIYYRQRLRDEIIDSPDFTSTVNATGTSRRQGIEVEAGWTFSKALRLNANYAWLDATEQKIEGVEHEREHRRPRHNSAIVADGEIGQWSYGASLTYTGRHRDRRDSAPFDLVDLEPYWLANVRVAYRLSDGIEAHVRVANVLASQYQDLAGYRTEGRTIHAGLRLAVGR
ncbi:MAG: TonB-dependent receptor plug domain-containing protein [Sphingomicrobium sp.]